MLCLFILLVTYVENVFSTDISPNNSLSDINKTAIPTRKSENIRPLNDNEVLDYFYGNNSDTDQGNQADNLLSTVDMDTAKRLLELAQKRNFNTNYTELNKTIARGGKTYEAYYHKPYFLKKTLDLMKQSIYSTRYRLQDTRELRKDYSDDTCYNIAIFYGSLMQLRIKMDNVYATMMKLPYNVKFIWYLGLYERCLAMNVDITYMVETMFKIKQSDVELEQLESVEKPGG